jgi:SAM-dependent methyltransferase
LDPNLSDRVYYRGRAVSWLEDLDRRFYPDHVDEHVRFDALVRRYLRSDSMVLDAGAGRGIQFPHDYRATAARVVGVDLDPAVLGNPGLSEAAIADLCKLPYADGEFDLVISKYVFEHLDRPQMALRELRRVLKPGGHLLIHTPNRWHYVALGATMTPTRFHVWFNAQLGRATVDTFPTKYRANTPRRFSALAVRTGFRIVSIELLETKPHYLSFRRSTYLIGIAYERLVNRLPVLARFRAQLIADLQAV